MKTYPAILRVTAFLLGVLLSPMLFAQSTFDPVHEDTDIFLVNPNISAQRPNILIVLDTTANWSSAYENEKAALVSVVNSLTDSYNVGLMQFTGGSIEGTYIRYAIRRMTAANKTALATMVGNLTNAPATNGSGDKTNNAVPGQSMSEAYAYFRGNTSPTIVRSSGFEVRTDYTGNTNSSLIQTLGNNAFSTSPSSSSRYNSPVSDACQKNYIIYISNGPGSNQTGETSGAKNDLAAARAVSAASLTSLPLSPNGFQTQSWMDEWSDYLANTGFTVEIDGVDETAYASTYVLEVDPKTTGQAPDWTALLRNASEGVGKGKYFSASSGNSGAAIVEALNLIFNEIQAVNSVFASTTLPVSVNVRGTNLNQVYIGMFRPDAKKAPRWYGNLKMYKLKLDGNHELYLADANENAAENPSTGFITGTARSHWTTNSSFWGYRSAEENGSGGASDNPDGDLVEKGAVAQRLRTNYAASQSTRKLYTCTTGCNACTIGGSGTEKTCSSGSALSATPFDTTNTEITPASLGLGVKDVSPLTAKQTQTITALTDRRPASIATLTFGSQSISSFSNGGTTRTITSLSTSVTKAITALSAASARSATISAVSVAETSTGSGGSAVWTSKFTVTTSAAHDFSAGSTVTIAGNTASGGSAINGSHTIASVPSTTTFTFTMAGRNLKKGNDGTASTSVNTTSARATVASHGYVNGQSVEILGAAPVAFNGTYNVTVIDANTFTYIMGSAQGAAATLGSAKADTTTATATALAHGFSIGNSVIVGGANPEGYNGTVTITGVPSTDTFTYTVASRLSANTSLSVVATKGATTSVTVTTTTNHGYFTGNLITISGADNCYNIAGTSITVLSLSTFRYTTAQPCAANTTTAANAALTAAGSQYLVVEQRNHGFTNGDAVTVEGSGTPYALGDYSGTSYGPTSPVFLFSNFGITPASTPNIAFYCAYGTEADCLVLWQVVSPATLISNNSYTVRSTTTHRAYATVPGHGYSTGDSITIAGATQAEYNGTNTITVLDADNFYYSLATAPGPATTTSSLTASKNSTTAVATSVAHGYTTGTTVAISGASPSAFNGSFVVTVVDVNTFTYTLASAQGNASGTIVAASGSGSSSERDAIVNWVRGQDNAISPGGENNDGSMTDCRASVHSDVLHSRPAVINYNRYGGDNDVYVFYGANDGVFRAIKGGMTNDGTDPTSLNPGDEAWGFVPSDNFNQLKRLRNNSPKISSSFKKPYFMDGPIGVYNLDGNNDGKIDATDPDDGDINYLYIGARRGGRYLYSLDATNPAAPKFRWKIDNTVSGFSELGYTWSRPVLVRGINAHINPVLIFGGGYDPAVEDVENCTITSATSASVTYFSGAIAYTTNSTGCTKEDGTAITAASTPSATVNRTMGRALYVLDAVTGELVWWAGPPGSGASLEVTGMNFAMPSDPIVIRNESGGATNRAYIGDTGGNLWRFDFGDADPSNWTVTKLASLADLTTKSGRRKFLYPPDVVADAGFYAILIGSGDREHPFDYSVTNRFYMLKDKGNDFGPLTGTDAVSHPTLIESALFDATSNCLQECTGSDLLTAQTSFYAAEGWYITLGLGEKNIGNAVALNKVVFFNTNQPSTASGSNCESNLGTARQYKVAVADGTAPKDINSDGTINAADRSKIHAGGGYLPSPVHVVVQVENAEGVLETIEGVISGTEVDQPPGTTLNARTRQYWYKEVD